MSDDRRPWRVDSTAIAHQNPYFRVLEQGVVANGSTRMNFFSIWFPRPAVGVVARRGTDFLLIRQYRFLVDEYVWAIPSGGVAEGESPLAAAEREFREETGMTARSLTPLLSCYASYGCSNQEFQIFQTKDVDIGNSSFDPLEVMSVRWFPRNEVLAMARNNGIVDNLSLSPILLALLND